MVKKLLIPFILNTQINILFAVKELDMSTPTYKDSIALMSFNNTIPGETLPDGSLKSYQERDKNIRYRYLEHLIKYTSLLSTPKYQVRVHEFKSSSISNSLTSGRVSPTNIISAVSNSIKDLTLRYKYIVLDFTSATPFAYKYLSFVWQRKSYNHLNQYEKQIANYYKANSSSRIKFLYAYDRPNSKPWAIMINREPKPIIWVKAEIKEVPNSSKPDPFLIIDAEDQDKSLSLLMDENEIAIAININGNTTFRN